MLKDFEAHHTRGGTLFHFLQEQFCRVSSGKAGEFCKAAGVHSRTKCIDLEPHQIILAPLVTEKGTHQSTNEHHNAYSFVVNLWANKTQIKHAVQELFNVRVLGDTVVEGNETVSLTLNTPTGGVTVGTPAAATLTIAQPNDSSRITTGMTR